MSSDTTLSQDQFSKIASALLGKSQGEVDINDRAKLLAFAKALVNDDSDADGEDSPTPAQRCLPDSAPRKAIPVISSDEESIKHEEVSDSEDEEAALEAMLLKAQESVTGEGDPQTD